MQGFAWVRRHSKLTGRVGSGQEVFQISWDGSGVFVRTFRAESGGYPDPIRPARSDPSDPSEALGNFLRVDGRREVK